MNVKEAIMRRQSVRSFTGRKIPDHIIYDIILHAHQAPSAGNLQARDFITVDDPEIKRKLCQAALNQEFLIEAPVDIVVCANLSRIKPYGKRGRELYCIQDSAAAVDHIILLAVEYGLATCWVGAFNEAEVAAILNLPDHIRPVAIIPLGYPQNMPQPTSRIDVKKLTHTNQW
ncbi:MAG TPA: nitroreductase family protein [Candidatus Thermoplasmatota archaeon]|nr:nitroreductase family protein [Candidatus Thermoplasmatota archaeon]